MGISRKVGPPAPPVLFPSNGNGNVHLCPIHNVEMRRWEKDGRVWFSHKTDDGGWCGGKSK